MIDPGSLPPGVIPNITQLAQIVSFLVGAISGIAFVIAASQR